VGRDIAAYLSTEVLPNMATEPDRHTELPADESDIVWGAANIGRELNNRTAKEVSYLLNRTSLLDGMVKRVGHRTLVASRKRLRSFAETMLERD
jgi:hypothetical protein